MSLFCCPICHAPLQTDGNTLRCPARHCFDIAAEGYCHLVPSSKMHAKIPGDSRDMVASRRRFLSAGFYEIFSDAINISAMQILNNNSHPVILDAGCGEGYYTARLGSFLRSKGLSPKAAGFDISKFAVKAAAKQDKQTEYAVASSFDIPAADHTFDFMLNVFAPIVPAEFARVLRPSGGLLIAVPSPRHLFGLKKVLYDTPYENETIDTAYDGFTFLERIPVRGELFTEDPQQIQALFMMTPYYWKTPVSGCERLKQCTALSTEIGFDLLIYRRTADDSF